MKKLPFSLALLAAVSSAAVAASGANGPKDCAFGIVSGGLPCATIVGPVNETVRSDVSFFTNAVFRCTGALIPVAPAPSACGRRIVFEIEDRDILHEDAYDVVFQGADTMLVRGSAMSCRWALNRILERDLGVVFCFPGPHGTHYPKTNALSVARVPFSGDASLKVERLMWREDPAWTRALGGKENKGQLYMHNLCNIFPVEKYGEEPWLSKIMPADRNGKRRRPGNREMFWQPCFSAPETVSEAVANICAYLRAHPDERVFSLSVNDNGGYCLCERCKAENGGSFDRKSRFGAKTSKDFSPVYYKWVEKVAKAVGREFPGVMLGLLAYGSTMDPPERPLPPNVVPFICGSVYQSHNEEIREKRLAQMREWSGKASSFGVWDYAYGAVQYPLPRMYLKTVGEFFAHKTNDVPSLNAMFAEGSSFMGEGPKRYFHYKMMFDAGQDRKALLDAWYRACCGEKAAPFLRAYYDRWEAFWTGAAIRKTPWYGSIGNGYCAFNESTYLYALAREDLDKGTELMEKAYAAAMESGDADQKIRAERLRDFSRYYAARCLGDGACGPLREHNIKDAATAKTFFEALPEMTANMDIAMKYAEKIVAVKRKEPFPMSVHADASFLAKTRANTGVVDWLNDAQGFLGDPQVRAAAKAAAEDRRTSKRYSAILKTLIADPRTSTNYMFGNATDDDAERRLWEPLEEWGIRLESLVSGPDGNKVFEVTGRPGWPALRKVVPDAKCGRGMLCGFSARVENLSDKPIAVRITYTPGRGLERKFTVKPGETGTAELIGTPGAKNTTYYVILNGIPDGGKAKVDRIVLRHLE